ncbi:hypothetical protein [Sphingobium yanoikuyae]|uniref:hypothetical protein n=1 Tax=Sphingobium yanoikuyae TaxID=13690 RepID=UPI0022DE251D|nr:hypothetical protein [Sphingobium yanoikuyae]WBQ14829.1 hypothetical protein PAE53_12885 [Sphingobium yanoikuyae]
MAEFASAASQLHGLILGLVGVALAVIVWLSAPAAQVRVAWLWITIIISLIVIWLLIETCRRIRQRSTHYLPRVLKSIPNNGLNNNPVLILESSELFGHGSLVTIFYVNDQDIELQVGSGHVSTIQTDRKIQVEITQWANAHQPVLQRVVEASVDVLGRLLIKPTVTSGTISGMGFESLDSSPEVETQD